MKLNELTAEQRLAVATLVSEADTKKLKAEVIKTHGPQTNVVVAPFALAFVGGELRIGSPSTMAPKSRLLSTPVLALLLHRLGAVAPTTENMLMDILAETSSAEDVEAYIARTCPAAWAVILRLNDRLKTEATPIVRSPSVSGRVDVQVVPMAADQSDQRERQAS